MPDEITIKIGDLTESSVASDSYVVVTRVEGGVRVSRKLNLSVLLSAISTALAGYTYSKTAIDNMIANVQVDLSAYSTTSQMNTAINAAIEDAVFIGQTIEQNVTIGGL